MPRRGDISPVASVSTLRDDSNGLRATLGWDVVAESAVDARELLSERIGVSRGTVYHNLIGEVPDPFLTAQAMSIEGEPEAVLGNYGKYRIVVEYSRGSSGQSRREAEVGGTPVVRIESSLNSGPADIDRFGRPIHNTVEEPLDPPSEAIRPNEVLVVEWFVTGVTRNALLASLRPFLGKLNEAAFYGAARGGLLCHGVTPEEHDSGVWRLTGRWEYREPQSPSGITAYYTKTGYFEWTQIQPPIEGWAEVRSLVGRRKRVGSHLDPVSERYEPIKDAQGNDITEPVPINQIGEPTADGDNRALVIYHYDYADFTDLGIG